MGLQKKDIVEDAVNQMRDVQVMKETVVILKVNDLPLRIVVQAADRIMDIITQEEAEQSGLDKIR